MTTLLAPFRYAYDFAQRHKKKILVAGVCGTAAAGYVLYSKVKDLVPMLKDVYQRAQSQQKIAAQQLLNARFEHNFRVARVTVSDFALRLRNQLNTTFNITELQKKLKTGQGGQHDLANWHEFRVQAMTRTLSALYSLCFVNLLIKIQLSIVSRYMFHDAQQRSKQGEQVRPDTTFNDFQARLFDNSNKQFFGLSEHAQKQGLTKLTTTLKEAVASVLTEFSLDSLCSLEEIQGVFTKIQRRFEQLSGVDDEKTGSAYLQYLFPPDHEMEEKLNTAEQQMNHRLEAELEDLDKKSQTSLTTKLEEEKLSQIRERRKQIARALNAHAAKRLREMTQEAMAIIKSNSFKWLVSSSLEEEFLLTIDLLKSAWSELAPKPSINPPLTRVIVRISKMFSQLLPEDPSTSPLLHVANNIPSVKELCAFIYYPMNLKDAMESVDISSRKKTYDELQLEPVLPSLPPSPLHSLFDPSSSSSSSEDRFDQNEQLQIMEAMQAQFAQFTAQRGSIPSSPSTTVTLDP